MTTVTYIIFVVITPKHYAFIRIIQAVNNPVLGSTQKVPPAYQPTYPPSGPTYRPTLPPTAPVYPSAYPPMRPI